MSKKITLEEVLELAVRLPPGDQIRLVEAIAPRTETRRRASPLPRKSLRGLWKGLDISEEDIAEARREMWTNFPREDI